MHQPTLPQATYGKKDPQSALSPGTKRMVRGKPGFNFSSRKGIKTPFWTKIKSSCLKCWAADSERIWMRTSWTSGCTWKLSPKDGHWMLTIDIYIYISLVSLISSKYVYIYILVCVCLDILIFMYIMYIYDDIWWPLCSPQTNGHTNVCTLEVPKPPDHLQCYPCTESTTGKDFGPPPKIPKKIRC